MNTNIIKKYCFLNLITLILPILFKMKLLIRDKKLEFCLRNTTTTITTTTIPQSQASWG